MIQERRQRIRLQPEPEFFTPRCVKAYAFKKNKHTPGVLVGVTPKAFPGSTKQ